MSPLSKSLQQTTNSGQPDWISGPIPTQEGAPNWHGANDLAEVADVPPGQTYVNVAMPLRYDKPTAAHETTHVFQNTRNDRFQDLGSALLPHGAQSQADYDYGGVKGLMAHPRKTITDYNPEQQAQMVEDLTRAQGRLTPRMSRQQLQNWDTTKMALERPIRQLANIPQADSSLGGRVDHYLHDRGFGEPIARLRGILSPPSLDVSPLPPPAAPSVALGYANRSKLVR